MRVRIDLKQISQIKRLPARLIGFSRAHPTAARYAVDGLFIAAATNMVSNNNNLFATRLGADDFQLSLLQFVPQAVNLLVLIPGGLAADSMRNKRKMVTGSLLFTAAVYMLAAAAPLFAPAGILTAFIALLSVSAGALTLYNISWQSFFAESVAINARNSVLSLRTQVLVFMGVLSPLATGAALALIKTESGKIAAHQGFFAGSALLLLAAAYNFRKLTALRPAEPKNVSLAQFGRAVKLLAKNKPFLWFAAAALFFYCTWQMDWTLYYIGQVRYLRMNEFLLGLAVVGGTGMQFFTLRFWSRKNEKHGVVLPVTFGILGLASCPLAMLGATALPARLGPYAFVLFNTLANACFVTITLNMFQCLLQVLDEEYRSLSISIYTCLTCFSNAVMPVAGVTLYQLLGGDLPALRTTFWVIFLLRVAAAGLWLLRWKSLPPEVKTR